MKDITIRFEDEQDYINFLEDIREDNKQENFMTEVEDNNTISILFKSSEEFKNNKEKPILNT
jgi:hypothetical protein